MIANHFLVFLKWYHWSVFCFLNLNAEHSVSAIQQVKANFSAKLLVARNVSMCMGLMVTDLDRGQEI